MFNIGILGIIHDTVMYSPVTSFLLLYVVQIQLLLVTLTAAVVLACSWKNLKKPFQSISKHAWLLVALIFLLGAVMRFLPLFTHLMYIDEHYYMAAGKDLVKYGVLNGCFYSDSTTYGCGIFKPICSWAYALSMSFFLVGVSDYNAVLTSCLMGIASILVIFLVTFLVTKKETIAVFASALLALLPMHIDWSRTAENNVFALFMALLFFLFFFMYLRCRSPASHVLAVVFFILALQVRFEYGLLIFFIAAGYALFRVKIKSLLFWVPWILFIVSFPFIFVQAFVMFGGTNQMYGTEFFVRQFIGELQKFSSGIYEPLIMMFFLGIGLIALAWKKTKETCLLLLMCIPLFLFYAFWGDLQGRGRYFLICFIPLLIMQAAGLDLLLTPFQGDKRRVQIAKVCVLIALIVLLGALFFPLVVPLFSRDFSCSDLHLSYLIAQKVEQDTNKDCLIVTNEVDAFIISGGSNLRVMFIEHFFRANASVMNTSQCLYYYEGMICRREFVSEKDKAECAGMHSYFKLDVYKDYFSDCPVNFTLYRITANEK